MTTNNAINSPINLPAYSLTPYIVGTDNNSQYTTISSAITQAVSDGASSTSPKVIYVKPGTYNESLTLKDGIYVIGAQMETISYEKLGVSPVLLQKSVVVSGTVTFSQTSTSTAIACGLNNITLTYDTASNYVFNVNDNVAGAAAAMYIYLYNVNWSGTNAGFILMGNHNGSSTGGTITFNLNQCTALLKGSNLFYSLDSTNTTSHQLSINGLMSTLIGNNTVQTQAYGNVSINFDNGNMTKTKLSHSSAGTLSLSGINNFNLSGVSGQFCISTGSGQVSIALTACNIAVETSLGSYDVDLSSNTNTSSYVEINNCVSGGSISYIDIALNGGISVGQGAVVSNFKPAYDFTGRDYHTEDMFYYSGIKTITLKDYGTLQTTNASSTAILSFATVVGATNIEADIYGCNAANSDFYSAKLVNALLWDGSTATLGTTASLAPTIVTTATSSITNSTNTININVQGVAATTWNWACEVRFRLKD
jgi:hypothetical protein